MPMLTRRALARLSLAAPVAALPLALIAATPLPVPGLGRIVRDGGRFAWLPLDRAHG